MRLRVVGVAAGTGLIAELVGLLAAMVILLIAFGSIVAMGLPIGTAVIGLTTGTGLVAAHLGVHERS